MAKLDRELPGFCTRQPGSSPAWLQRRSMPEVERDPGDALMREFEQPVSTDQEEILLNQLLSFIDDLLAEKLYDEVDSLLALLDIDFLSVATLTKVLARIDPYKSLIPNRTPLMQHILARLLEESG